MAVKSKSQLDKLTNDELVKYLDSLSLEQYNDYVDGDTKIRYFIYVHGENIAKFIKNTNLFFPAVTAMKCYESGYGKRIPPNSFNYGGVKYNPNIHSDYVLVDTFEYVNKKKVPTKAKFAKFKNAEDGLKQNIGVLLGNRYKKARDEAKSPEEQIKMIASLGYTSTPPDLYLREMSGIVKRIAKKTGFGKIV